MKTAEEIFNQIKRDHPKESLLFWINGAMKQYAEQACQQQKLDIVNQDDDFYSWSNDYATDGSYWEKETILQTPTPELL